MANEDNLSKNPFTDDITDTPDNNPEASELEDEGGDTNDINEISAHRTEEIEDAPDPDGPADPDATT